MGVYKKFKMLQFNKNFTADAKIVNVDVKIDNYTGVTPKPKFTPV